jgi:hypothetical protein
LRCQMKYARSYQKVRGVNFAQNVTMEEPLVRMRLHDGLLR